MSMNLRRLPIALAVLTVSIAVARAAEAPAWPGLGKDAPCLKEQWPKARTLVWAKPGEGGTALDAANWTEFAPVGDDQAGKAGKPATAGPDANTDLVLPDAPAGQAYTVGFMVCVQYPKPIWPPRPGRRWPKSSRRRSSAITWSFNVRNPCPSGVGPTWARG